MRQRAHVFYSGRVQGVGFRYSVREVACGFEVTGFVGNYIRTEDVNWRPATGEFVGFEIRY